jgi:uncharacterized protein involved in tolerance to divalent cations
MIVIHTTASSAQDAERLAEALVGEGLAACVQILPILSVYAWKGEVQREPEHLLQIKTRAELFEVVRARIRQLHSYETPEVVAIPATDADPDYLAWLESVSRRP